MVWIACSAALMVADVWDETNGMLFFSNPSMALGEKVRYVLTEPLGFWRPLPALLVTLVLHFVPDFDLSWRVLRAINVAMLLGSLALLLRAAQAPRMEGAG